MKTFLKHVFANDLFNPCWTCRFNTHTFVLILCRFFPCHRCWTVILNFSDRLELIVNISVNFIGAVHLAGPIAKISKGLCRLSLSHCGLTAKGVNQMAHSLTLNQSISSSLTYLDLSGNNLKDDINVSNNIISCTHLTNYFWWIFVSIYRTFTTSLLNQMFWNIWICQQPTHFWRM